MGNYLPVYRSLWQSRRFTKLQPIEKLVYLNLITNKQTSQSGVYNILPQYIAVDCGISLEELKKVLKRLQELQMIEFYEEENLIFIHKFFKYSKGTVKNPKILSKVLNRERELINNPEVWNMFDMEFNQELHLIDEALMNNKSNKDNDNNDNNTIYDNSS